MKKALFLFLITAVACSGDTSEPDAYGNFEATEITVSAEYPGKILRLEVKEGQKLQKGEVIGLIDTAKLHLQKQQVAAKNRVLRARFPGISSELEVIEQQRENLLQEIERFRTLADKGAAPAKQADDLEDQVAVLEKRVKAVQSQNQPLSAEMALNNVQVELLELQIQDAIIRAPVSGTVLLKLAETGEVVTTGMPLLHMADLDTLVLRAFVSGAQLDDVVIGDRVQVLTDKDEETYHEHTGTLTWVASEAEFTPRSIQTKEERVDQVYAIKIDVPNDGTLKIGMPAEVLFTAGKARNR